MQRNDWRLRIKDMLDAIAEVEAFTRDMDFSEFSDDIKTIRAVAYDFVILGEAARGVPSDIEARYPLGPWDKIKGMRNVVAHEYRYVSVKLLWSTLERDLPPIVSLLRDVLDQNP